MEGLRNRWRGIEILEEMIDGCGKLLVWVDA